MNILNFQTLASYPAFSVALINFLCIVEDRKTNKESENKGNRDLKLI